MIWLNGKTKRCALWNSLHFLVNQIAKNTLAYPSLLASPLQSIGEEMKVLSWPITHECASQLVKVAFQQTVSILCYYNNERILMRIERFLSAVRQRTHAFSGPQVGQENPTERLAIGLVLHLIGWKVYQSFQDQSYIYEEKPMQYGITFENKLEIAWWILTDSRKINIRITTKVSWNLLTEHCITRRQFKASIQEICEVGIFRA